MAEVATPEAFGNAKRFGLWMSGAVEPALVVEPRGRHNKRVPLPPPDRVTQPGRIGVLGEIAAIGEHGSKRAVGRLIQNQSERRRLDDPGQVEKIVERDADGQASREGTVLSGIPHALQEQRLGPGLDVLGFEILSDVEAVEGAGASPDASQIRLAVRGPRGGRGHVGLAVGQARGSRSGVLEPLCGGRRRQKRCQNGKGGRTGQTNKSHGALLRPTIISSQKNKEAIVDVPKLTARVPNGTPSEERERNA